MVTAPAPRTQSSATWKPPAPDRRDVDHRQREDRVEVPGDRLGVLPHLADAVPAGARRALVGQRAHPLARRGIEEDAVGADELERVPLDRVVARGQDEPGARVMVLDRQLHRRRRHHAEVDARRPRPT